MKERYVASLNTHVIVGRAETVTLRKFLDVAMDLERVFVNVEAPEVFTIRALVFDEEPVKLPASLDGAYARSVLLSRRSVRSIWVTLEYSGEVPGKGWRKGDRFVIACDFMGLVDSEAYEAAVRRKRRSA